MKEILGFAVSFIVVVLLIHWLSGDLEKEYNKQTNSYKQFVGKKVVVFKDILLITDYSWLAGKLYLNNGAEISKEFAKKNIVKKDSTQ